ncbi:MAG: UDP-N-acetylmuramoyl-tripeptide--D-alanyl-D-alanine ligase [Cellulophaga sp.]
MTIEKLHEFFLQFPIVSTDTRKIIEGCIFFSLKGTNFNGNKYAKKATEQGAVYAIVDEEKYISSDKTILVDNVLETLQQLATFHRNYCSAKIIGITGSNGKTTTKELIREVLSKKYKTIATAGNLNNHIGVPLTLLTIKKDTEIAIIEMGANHKKEIEFLCALAQPDFGYVTNFGKAHIEGFESIEGVIKGKSELYDYLIVNDKSVFINADDPIQEKKLGGYIKKYGFSKTKTDYYLINFTEANPFVSIDVEGIEIKTQLIGSYNFLNCCAAIVFGKYFNVSLQLIQKALQAYIPQNNRSQIIQKNGHHIILDAYNANPTSMTAALENFNTLKEEDKIIFLGDMFELGNTAAAEHQNIADLATKMNFHQIFLIGENFNIVNSSAMKFDSYTSLEIYLKEHSLNKSNILIKGSRGMALERIVTLL